MPRKPWAEDDDAKRRMAATAYAVGKKIYYCRLEAGITQTELAHRLRMSIEQVKRYESGRPDKGRAPLDITISLLGSFADALGVSLSALLPDEEGSRGLHLLDPPALG